MSDKPIEVGQQAGEVIRQSAEASPVPSRLCTMCAKSIPLARLKAVPNATTCVPCLERVGDVPKIRRYDETTKDDVVQTYFTHNPYIEGEIARQNRFAPPDKAFEHAVGDDSFKTRCNDKPVAAAVSHAEIITTTWKELERIQKAIVKELWKRISERKSNIESTTGHQPGPVDVAEREEQCPKSETNAPDSKNNTPSSPVTV